MLLAAKLKKAGSKAALFLKRQEESSPTKGVSVIN